ncbi:hypothetical protein PF008_g5764 [Phytophthora fragariae]|uniref:Uncharacterized protein n=1 Tax=Phytophthora fragariae TaxID=53985 RepID=A0A6G0S7E8_9STRA|nr:hypothetical protein PF008_g5764 [Phytophthora fragariae]
MLLLLPAVVVCVFVLVLQLVRVLSCFLGLWCVACGAGCARRVRVWCCSARRMELSAGGASGRAASYLVSPQRAERYCC